MNLNVAALLLLVATAPAAFAQSTPVAPEHRELVHALLEESLEQELRLLQRETETHWGTRNEYLQQIKLRGRVGETDQIQRLIDAILTRHEERNFERSRGYYGDFDLRFADPTSTAAGWEDMIRQGKLDEVHTIIRQRTEQPKPRENPGFAIDEFWTACKLAVAYYKIDDTSKVRTCLNLARRIRENTELSGEQFDASDEWLPEMPESRYGFSLETSDQSRLTFYVTLIQSGYSELAINWFLAHSSNPKVPEHGILSSYFENTTRFVEQVARHASAEKAAEVVETIFGRNIPAEMHAAVIKGGLARNEISTVQCQVELAIVGLDRSTTQWGFGYQVIIENLLENNRPALALALLEALVDRIDRHVQSRLKADNGDLEKSTWNDAASQYLAFTAARIDKDAAVKIVRLHETNPPAGHESFDGKRPIGWLMMVVKTQCGVANDVERHSVTKGEPADSLIEAYLADGRTKLAREVLQHASAEIRQTTASGASVAGKGLAVMGNNPHERILLARHAIRFSDFELARELLDEIPNNATRREGYRDVTYRIAEEHGWKRAKVWLDETSQGISKSGGILGLVQFLVPENKPMDIPRPWSPAC